MNGLLLAVGFLTVIPVPPRPYAPGDLGRAAGWFPLVGLVLGGILLAALLVLTPLNALLGAALLVTLWVALTGGLHLDGLADCCDGLLPPGLASPARRLEIMHDPHLGVFGAIGLFLFLTLKILAVASLVTVLQNTNLQSPITDDVSRITQYVVLSIPILLAPSISRWLILIVAAQPAAQAGGRGAEFSRGLSRSVYVAAAIIPVILILAGGWPALAAALAAHLIAFVIIRVARARLGGINGDVLGLTIEAAELVVLLTYVVSVA